MRVATEHRTLTADPGASVTVVVDVVNTGDLIDGVTARVVGLDAATVRAEPEVLPTEWFQRAEPRDRAGRARVVCDYIAGMTDRFAIEEHRKLFNLDLWA